MRHDYTILALDPGLRDLGYAVLSGRRLLTAGVQPLRAVPADDRLSAARQFLATLIRGYEPTALVWESVASHSMLGHSRVHRFIRWAERKAVGAGLETASYSAKAVRENVVGDGWATKPDTAKVVCAYFPELRVYLGQDRKWKAAHWHNLFDAVALALHHQSLTKPPSRSR